MDPTISAGLALINTILFYLQQYATGAVSQQQLDQLWAQQQATFAAAVQAWETAGQPAPQPA